MMRDYMRSVLAKWCNSALAINRGGKTTSINPCTVISVPSRRETYTVVRWLGTSVPKSEVVYAGVLDPGGIALYKNLWLYLKRYIEQGVLIYEGVQYWRESR